MTRTRTTCNPMDLSYRLQNMSVGPKRFVCREAADPSLVLFRDRYYLFPSMSGGFWHSADLVDWTFVATPTLPNYDYAPDVHIIDDMLVVCASRPKENCSFYRSADPLSGRWEEIPGSFPFWDPALFLDDDNRLYLYWGCSGRTPIWGIELDRQSFQPIGERTVLIQSDTAARGWERKGENHQGPPKTLGGALIGLLGGKGPFIEGAWMTKHDGRYYLQYSAPGTELNTYADGYFVGTSPLGPFTYAPQSPFSFKPAGFINAAGHGSTFHDRHGNWWHTASMRISRAYMFERRLGLFPAGFDNDGALFCNQEFADYPLPMPDGPVDPWSIVPPWMLLSCDCPATASSSAPGHPPALAVNEDIRTWWTPADANQGHWITIDLGENATTHAIQVNLAEHKMQAPKRPRSETHQTALWRRYLDMEEHPAEFLLEGSADGEAWTVIEDTRGNSTGRTHHYIELAAPRTDRYVRLTGFEQPYGGSFAVSGLRVFGLRAVSPPQGAVPVATRIGALDARVSWGADPAADGYNVRYGLAPDKLYNSWMVRDQSEIVLSSLNAGHDYWVAVDAFNSGGIKRGEPVRIGGSSGKGTPWLAPLLAAAAVCVAALTGSASLQAADPVADSDVQVSYRRLTEDQYRQSIADIFGADIVVSSRLEPDPRRDGLIAIGVAAATVSGAGFEKYDAAARAIAAQVTDRSHRAVLIGCAPADARHADAGCAEAFLKRTGRLLFRRPLQPQETARYVALAGKAAEARGDFHSGLATALTTMLEAPAFLFRSERAVRHGGVFRLDDFSIASRLSFMVWNAPPDNALLAAAERGELTDPQGLSRQLDRTLASPRFEHGVRAFFTDMLALDDLDGLQKDPAIYPRFSNRLASDAREQTLRTIVDALVRKDEDYRSLFTSRRTFLSRSLGLLYGMPVTSPNGWEPVEFATDDPRAGLVAQPAFLMGHSHPGRSSPTLRGKAIRELLLCQPVPAPPPNVNFAIVQNVKDPRFATARQRLQVHNDDAMCAGCHKLMDPLGLSLENFDGAGGMRKDENGTPLDLSGSLGTANFTGAAGLGEALSRDPALSSCLISRLYAYGTGRADESDDLWLDALRASEEARGLRLRSIIRAMVLSDEFRRANPEPPSAQVAFVAKPGGAANGL